MIKLIGNKFENKETLIPLKYLYYYDGPLLATSINNNKDLFLILWVDNNSEVNRWMKIPVSQNNYDKYLNQELTLQQIIFENETVIFYEIFADNNLFEEINFISVDIENIPEDYLPTKDSFYRK